MKDESDGRTQIHERKKDVIERISDSMCQSIDKKSPIICFMVTLTLTISSRQETLGSIAVIWFQLTESLTFGLGIRSVLTIAEADDFTGLDNLDLSMQECEIYFTQVDGTRNLGGTGCSTQSATSHSRSRVTRRHEQQLGLPSLVNNHRENLLFRFPVCQPDPVLSPPDV
jgi:hypothetical protein